MYEIYLVYLNLVYLNFFHSERFHPRDQVERLQQQDPIDWLKENELLWDLSFHFYSTSSKGRY